MYTNGWIGSNRNHSDNKYNFNFCRRIRQFSVLSILLVLVAHQLPAQNFTEIRVTESFENEPLVEILDLLEKNYELNFSYLDETVSGKTATIDAENMLLEDFLNRLLTPLKIGYKFEGNSINLYLSEPESPNDMDDSGTFTIRGFITDGQNGESLAGAHIFVPGLHKGVASNRFGFYSLTLPANDTLRVVYSYVGYALESKLITGQNNQQLSVSLQPSARLGEVVVVGNSSESIEEQTLMSRVQVPTQKIQETPTLLGEADIMKTIQLLPGVHRGNDGTGGLFVRGSGPDQNLILLDGVTVYNANHLFGFVSIFNTNAVQNVQFSKGGFPARYGGRLASVVDIQMKEGNKKKFGGVASIGLLASQVTLEGPIKSEKTSFMISGRRTYADLLARPFIKRQQTENEKPFGGYFFHDLNAKLNHTFSTNNRVYFSIYTGLDKFFLDNRTFSSGSFSDSTATFRTEEEKETDLNLNWGNFTSTLRWNTVLSNKIFGNLTLTYSNFDFNFDLGEISHSLIEVSENGEPVESRTFNQTNILDFGSGIRDWSGRVDVDYFPVPEHSIKFGVKATMHRYRPETLEIVEAELETVTVDTTLGAPVSIDNREFAAWIEDTWSVTERFSTNFGVHFSGYETGNDFFYDIQPRISMAYHFPNEMRVKASFASMKQYTHLLTNNTISLPTDLWLPSTRQIKPEKGYQAALGIERGFAGGKYHLTVESYYKKLANLISFKEGIQSLTITEDFADKIVSGGEGEAYGLEILLKKEEGKLTGWLAYTLARSTRKFEAINFGEKYPFKYDRRHDFSITGTYRLADHIKLTGNWVFYTGAAVTVNEFSFLGLDRTDVVPGFQFTGFRQFSTFENRNAVRMRNTHRLDLGVHFTKENRWGVRTWGVGLYNTYSRNNPFFLFSEEETEFVRSSGDVLPQPQVNTQVKEFSLIPVLPYVNYKLEF